MRNVFIILGFHLSMACFAQDQSLPPALDSGYFVGISRDTVGLFTKVEKQPEFPGGIAGWRKFLYANLDPQVVLKDLPKKTKQFKQTAIVQFIVCTDGTVCEVKVVNDVLPSVKQEAERVINHSGKWVPAMQDGKKVKTRFTQAITFMVE